MDFIEVERFFIRESNTLDEIVEFIKTEMPFETYSSILSYFCCYYSDYQQDYFDFISKINYKQHKHAGIIENPIKWWWKKNVFTSVLGTLVSKKNIYRYVFLYTPFSYCSFFELDSALTKEFESLELQYKENEYNQYLKNVLYYSHTNFYY